jgi:hypothetical protein
MMSPIHERMKRIRAMREELSVHVRSLIYDLGIECGDVNDSPPLIRIVQETCAVHFDVPLTAMRSPVRTTDFVIARHAAMFLARVLTHHPLVQIGNAFNRDHGCVLHAERCVKNRMETDKIFAARIAAAKLESERKIAARTDKPVAVAQGCKN